MTLTSINVLDVRARLGECPVWDSDRQHLFFVDIYNQRVHQFDPLTRQSRFFATGEVVSAIALAGPQQLLIALRDRLAYLNLQTGDITPLVSVEFPAPQHTRFNDGKCDAQGRFWIGSCSDQTGQATLHRYDPDGALQLMETGLTIANGLGWSPDHTTFYLTDSARYQIFAYDFDAASGSIDNRRVLIDLSPESAEPDGLAIDAAGNLWSALWGGWAIACFSPSGQAIHRIQLPIPMPTGITFGGIDLTDLYVTSACIGLSQTEIQQSYTAGDLYCVPTEVKGMPTQPFGAKSALIQDLKPPASQSLRGLGDHLLEGVL